MPQTWCGGVITPICYKSGGRSDPANYRGICVSSQPSCWGKLFSSIFLNILHKSQISFLSNNRTADHVFTLRTLIDKYVHNHNEKIYACFVHFKKAFDSVWPGSWIGVGGSLYNIIKRLGHNPSCSIELPKNKRDHSIMREMCGNDVSQVHCF